MKKETTNKKLKNYLDYFIKSNFFQNQIKIARDKLDIPKKGFEKNKKVNNLNYLDLLTHKPEKFEGSLKSINLSLKEIIKKSPLNSFEIKAIFKFYLLYNEKEYKFLKNKKVNSSMCKLSDDKTLIDEYSTHTSKQEVVEMIKSLNKNYPISIKIHPNASQRDIISYIKENWGFIKIYQNQYRNNTRLGKIKTKDKKIQKRNDFIYKNRKLGIEKLRKKVREQFRSEFEDMDKYLLDPGHISKIINLEEKKRKEV